MTTGGPTLDTLPALCRHAAATWPDRIGLVFDETGEALTFAEIDTRSDRIAAGLAARGAGPGDRVAVMLPNCPDFPLAWLGIAKAGAVMGVQPRSRSVVNQWRRLASRPRTTSS